MASEWATVPLGSLVEPDRGISYGIVQPGTPVVDGVPIVRVSDVRDGRIATSAPLRVARNVEAAYTRTRLVGGELLLTLVGTVGESAVVPLALAGWNTARAVAVIPVRKDVGAYWVKLALEAPKVRETINSRLNTTVQATLNLGDVAQLPVVMPPKRVRETIADILGALDDKIELNRRMNATLEAMARALFQSWFVDFDPVRAKMAGREPAGMDAATAALFPAALQESELGPIPAGWRVATVGEVVECVGGSTPSTKEEKYWHPAIHAWATPKDLSRLESSVLLATERRISDAGLEKISSGLLPAGIVLLSSRAPVGYLAIAHCPVAINQGFIALLPNARLSAPFLLNWCRANMGEIEGRATGTTFPEISKTSFRAIKMIAPAEDVVNAFTASVSKFYSRIASNCRESAALTTMRDALLPKLLSGELDVAGVG
jgi:type I restriction enzyme S subunit